MPNRPASIRPTPRRARHAGVVLVLVLLGLFLLVGLLMFVLNLGRHANARVVAQNAADAAAISGSGWVARSFNTVALNNIGMTQLLTSVLVLDGMPQTLEFTTTDQTALQEAVTDQLGRAISHAWVRAELQKVQSELATELTLLNDVNEALNRSGQDVREMTFYDSPSGRGKLWQAMESMDIYNQATLGNLGTLAQLTAYSDGQHNLTTSGETIHDNHTLLIPVVPNVPYRRGQFDDFHDPLAKGLLPPGSDNRLTNRGPYDAVFGWRQWIYGGGRAATGTPVSGAGGNDAQARGRSSWSGQWPPGPPAAPRRPTGYTPYGPFKWTLDRAAVFRSAHLMYSRFDDHLQRQALIKLGYLWPQESIYTPDRPLPLKVRGYRNAADRAAGRMAWEINLVKDYRYWFDGPNMQRSNPPSNYFHLEDGVNTTSNDLVLRVVDQGDGRTSVTYISQATRRWVYDVVAQDGTMVLEGLGQGINSGRTGTYATDVPTPPHHVIQPEWITEYPRARTIAEESSRPIRQTAWLRLRFDKQTVTPPNGVTQVLSAQAYDTRVLWMSGAWLKPAGLGDEDMIDSYIWLDEFPAETQTLPDGTVVQHRKSAYYVFLGINVGPFVEVRNPSNFASRSQLPAPLDIDHTLLLANDPGSQRQYLTYLAAARRSGSAFFWPSRFTSGQPTAEMLALAQAYVFNDHSFDLWTPMWHAQAQTIQDYPGWIARLDATAGDTSQTPFLSNQEAQDLAAQMRALQPLANIMLGH